MAGYVTGVKKALSPNSHNQNGHYAPLVTPVHTFVRGRVRLHVNSLRLSDEMKAVIERDLPETINVERVSANPLTGNVLITFDPQLNSNHVIRSLESVVRSVNGFGRKQNGSGSSKNAALGRRNPNGALVKRKFHTDLAGPLPALARPENQPWHLLSSERVLATLQSSPAFRCWSVLLPFQCLRVASPTLRSLWQSS